jgi:hypothetical protein
LEPGADHDTVTDPSFGVAVGVVGGPGTDPSVVPETPAIPVPAVLVAVTENT